MMKTGKRVLAGGVAVTAVVAAGLATTSIRNGLRGTALLGLAGSGTDQVPAMQIGMNLGSPFYWTSEWPFADLVQGTGTLVTTNMPSWAQLDQPNSPLPLDAGGRPGPVRAGGTLGTILQLASARRPVGDFDCRVSPGWRVETGGAWTLLGSPDAPGGRFGMRITDPNPKPGVMILTTATQNGAKLDTLSCRLKGTPQGETFNPVFMAGYRPYGVLRFMDWMRTNAEGRRSWETRTTPASFSQAQPGGVALEHMVALANRLDADPWFTLPIDADPGYYRQFAEYVRDHLEPDRRAYVELSNEVWNSGFPQYKYAQERGSRRYPEAAPDEAADYYYADRVREVMDEWSRVFGAHRYRIVRVLASQTVWKERIERTVGHGDVAQHVDALATAAYFGTDGSRQPNLSGRAKVDAIFADGPRIVDEAIGYARMGRDIARRYGLRYVSYEGGPGFTSYAPVYQADLKAVEGDPRMEALYRSFLRRWKNEIGDLLVLYTGVATSGGGNLFGHRQYTGQPLSEAPKARATLDAAWGARIDTPASRP